MWLQLIPIPWHTRHPKWLSRLEKIEVWIRTPHKDFEDLEGALILMLVCGNYFVVHLKKLEMTEQ